MALPAFHQAHTFGEVVEPDLRERCSELLGVNLVDTYSSAEVGYMATQIRGKTTYHWVCAVPLNSVQRDELVVHLKQRFNSIEEGHKSEQFRCMI